MRRLVFAVLLFMLGIALHVVFRIIDSWYMCGVCDFAVATLVVLYWSGRDVPHPNGMELARGDFN